MPEQSPKVIGGYEVLEQLGKGGMGTVFKARQVSMDRLVALKVLPPKLAEDEAYVARFVREARAAAKLTHPNIVQGYDVGEADGTHYFAMELVDGPSVKNLLDRSGTIEEKKALNIAGAVARALEEAQRHGIVHRDIKPDNIMINSRGIVKLADLGLARTTAKVDTVTLDGTAIGTPQYMSPEQVRAEPDLDTRADIYALGATLYHMVTGEFPFDGPTPAAIIAKHIADPVP
ncbi:serine/threonine protein kinase, partial [bacterium]|nr:serine/threonine protein kinase [bacterium]